MKWGILLVTTGDREVSMLTALDSIAKYHPAAGVTAVLQGYAPDSPVYKHPQIVDSLSYPEGIGPHSARIAALPRMIGDGYDAIVNLDDDMELVAETDLRPSVLRSQVKGIGLVGNNWRRTPEMLAKVKPQRVFKNQAIIPTGGGLAYSRSTAEVILDGPDLDYLFDDSEWSLRAYLSGLENQRYQGSLAVHRIMGPGGRHGWVNKRKRALSDARYIKPRILKDIPGRAAENRYGIPVSRDLTSEARAVHRRNRANL